MRKNIPEKINTDKVMMKAPLLNSVVNKSEKPESTDFASLVSR